MTDRPENDEVTSITIVFKRGEESRILSYQHGAWLCEGPIYPRFLKLMELLNYFIKHGTVPQ